MLLIQRFILTYSISMVKMVVLLGNPGPSYAKSRHNVGWIFGSYWLRERGQQPHFQKKFRGEYARVEDFDLQLTLLKPLTFMNLSGQSVTLALNYFDLTPEEMLVIHDDLQLEYGKTLLQFGGSLAGHHGLQSIKKELNSDFFYRLRIGIGRPKQQSVSSYVLGRFTPEEDSLWPVVASSTLELLTKFFTDKRLLLPQEAGL